jgi:hypothetical protein
MAEDKKITDLTALLPSEVAVEDVLVIVDVNPSPETKKITAGNFLISKLPGDFSSLKINTGQNITEFSIDTTLGGDSDNAVPTEKAVKGYVDAAISSLEPDQIWADDSYVKVVDDGTTAGFIEIVADGTQVAYFDSLASTQRIGKQSNAGRLEISDTSSKLFGSNDVYIEVSASAVVVPSGLTEVFKIDENGIKLEQGVTVNRISNDPTLSQASETSLITEYAVKQFVDSAGVFGDRILDGTATIALVSETIDDSYFSVNVRGTYFSNDTTSVDVVFYFNEYNDSTALVPTGWLNPQNMVDGNTGTHAKAEAAARTFVQWNTGNNSTPQVGNIERVKLRVFGRDGKGPNISAFNFYPIFGGTNQGNSHNLRSFFKTTQSWTPWIDITQDPQAPKVWTWADVQNLDSKVEAILGPSYGALTDIVEVNKIEIEVTYTTNSRVVGSVERFRVQDSGISTEYGTSINEFSTDALLTDNSNRAVPTERAVKTYVDYQIQSVRNDLDLINIREIGADSTAVTGDVCLVNTTGGVVNIKMIENPDGRIIVKKISLDSNPVYVTTLNSSIDGESTFVVDVPYKSITFLSTGVQFYII